MRAHLRKACTCLAWLSWCGIAVAQVHGDGNVPDVLARAQGLRLSAMARPAQTYARNCQGCHGEAGVSVPEFPTLAGRVGYFTRVPEGRAYLVQVPNVALNAASDDAIAQLLNWVLVSFSREQLPADFVPYDAEEVGRFRRERIDVVARRAQVVERLLASGEIPSSDVLHLSAPDLALGRQKFVACAPCHGSDGREPTIRNYPKIGGQNAEYVALALRAYRDGRRVGTNAALMAESARALSNADIENLAAYVQSLGPN